MEKFQEARDKALKNLKIADHMVTVTYPLLKDNRLLLAATENLFLSVSNAMNAILYYDRLFKRVPPFADTFEVKFNLFKRKSSPRYHLKPTHAQLIQEVREILVYHRKSPVEFSRKNAFVICSSDYRLRIISQKDLKEYLSKAKVFIQLMLKIVQENEELFR